MRFANPKPPFCAACFQHSTGDHVDFEASYDGPVIEKDGIKIPVDDLILCRDCVRAAAELIGMVEPDRTAEYITGLEEHIEELKAEVVKKDKALSDLTYTNTTLAEFPIKRRAGKPHFKGVPDDIAKQLQKRRSRQDAHGGPSKKRPSQRQRKKQEAKS